MKTSGKKLWRWFVTPPTAAILWKRTAWSLWLNPPVMFLFLLPLLEPSSIPDMLANFWEAYLLFFGLPLILGVLCWRRGKQAADAD